MFVYGNMFTKIEYYIINLTRHASQKLWRQSIFNSKIKQINQIIKSNNQLIKSINTRVNFGNLFNKFNDGYNHSVHPTNAEVTVKKSQKKQELFWRTMTRLQTECMCEKNQNVLVYGTKSTIYRELMYHRVVSLAQSLSEAGMLYKNTNVCLGSAYATSPSGFRGK